ncbi:Acetate regulatory DNA binding protein FacB, putative [Penicillium digitatum PHI26]|uniref:Acetate regulatory DNA binding protein FacB, putative n=3 Tax=Penicillium digitatum TaxID=36651 RepID=K9FU54_PEND2|nr:Acetate regulatory DNA binding protein FacB, putative [Penicillium digitatum Pd1]EKV06263.1 Acetate regulatory DNA binding protein FacB, putative [Penicillium digitatum PHI26]EKV18399.1 Acetate regulatory DNA binding protein FacB, putative [Penicillium digitatum Pd1]
MPGILPMKVIKVGGTGTTSRIAQACDRCRSKKIRCDGVRPCCSQCANVGFECRTSDKLSRRAFPRGYTESLEERVRTLETEVKELKDLLDEKDEKIDVLSRIHSFSPSQRAPSARSPSASATVKSSTSDSSDGVFHVESSTTRLPQKSQNPFIGFSSTQGFADVFTNKLVSEGKSAAKVYTGALTALSTSVVQGAPNQAVKTPPRLVSDQLINIFFQEWAPLYPVVHRPTILKAYEQYLNNAETLQRNPHVMAQLNLIFGIAALSSMSRANQDPIFFEENWSATLALLSNETSVASLQCFVLGQIYCMTKGDYRTLLRYRALGVDICHQLGMHEKQESSGNPLEDETRKKVFWSQYVLDRFCSALTGLPILLREEDIETQYPVDVDDENVTETGFLPTLPGESTRISSAIALFGAARILNKALEYLYPSKSGYDVCVSKMRSVTKQLDEWLHTLPPHLRLEFSQDKPSTTITSSRSPLLSLLYYFIRSLIHRPAVCYADENLRSPSVLALSDSAKHIIQILELLDERRLCLSVSINRKELVFFSGLGLLWQMLDVRNDSKLAKDSQKLLGAAMRYLQSESSAAAAEFGMLSNTLISLGGGRRPSVGKEQHQEMLAPTQKPSKSPKKHLQVLKSRLIACSTRDKQPPTQPSPQSSRRNTISGATPPLISQSLRSPSGSSLPLTQTDQRPAPLYRSDKDHSPLDLASDTRLAASLGHDHPRSMSCSTPSDPTAGAITMADWEYVLSDMDRGYSNIFTGIYGGKECGEDPGPFASIAAEYNRKPNDSSLANRPQSEMHGLSPEAWSASSGDFVYKQEQTARSVLSYSSESMGSTEESVAPYADAKVFHEDIHTIDSFNTFAMHGEDEVDEFSLANGWDRRLAV